MIDLHGHYLPGVDDGAATMDDAVAMCRQAAADGIETLVTTPHQRHDLFPDHSRADLEARLDELRVVVGETPRILLGGEIRVDSGLLADLDAPDRGGLLPLAGSHYLLLEFPPLAIGPDPVEIVHELVLTGWWPILAHPERIPWLAGEPALLADLVRRGAFLQITAISLTGGVGRLATACCEWLLGQDLVAFVASDAHDREVRRPGLAAAWRGIAARWGEARAQRLMIDNPAAVLADRPISEVKA